MRDGKGTRFPIGRARGLACLAVVLSVVAGLALHAGWGTLSSLGLGSVASLCPLGALETLAATRLAVPRTFVALGAMVALAALFGRAFCSWVCPVPPVQRFFRPGGEARADGKRDDSGAGDDGDMLDGRGASARCSGCASPCALPPVGGERDGLRIDARHGVLAGALASSAVFGFPVFCLVCPVGLSFATLIAVWRAFAEHDPSWSLLVFPAILVLELVVFRRWCHVLCPLGALLSLVGAKAPAGRPRVRPDACLRSKGVDCRACVDACPELLDPHSARIPECTRCGACLERCPANAIEMPLLPKGARTRE